MHASFFTTPQQKLGQLQSSLHVSPPNTKQPQLSPSNSHESPTLTYRRTCTKPARAVLIDSSPESSTNEDASRGTHQQGILHPRQCLQSSTQLAKPSRSPPLSPTKEALTEGVGPRMHAAPTCSFVSVGTVVGNTDSLNGYATPQSSFNDDTCAGCSTPESVNPAVKALAGTCQQPHLLTTPPGQQLKPNSGHQEKDGGNEAEEEEALTYNVARGRGTNVDENTETVKQVDMYSQPLSYQQHHEHNIDFSLIDYSSSGAESWGDGATVGARSVVRSKHARQRAALLDTSDASSNNCSPQTQHHGSTNLTSMQAPALSTQHSSWQRQQPPQCRPASSFASQLDCFNVPQPQSAAAVTPQSFLLSSSAFTRVPPVHHAVAPLLVITPPTLKHQPSMSNANKQEHQHPQAQQQVQQEALTEIVIDLTSPSPSPCSLPADSYSAASSSSLSSTRPRPSRDVSDSSRSSSRSKGKGTKSPPKQTSKQLANQAPRVGANKGGSSTTNISAQRPKTSMQPPPATHAPTAPARKRVSKVASGTQQAFEAQREALARELYSSWNTDVFGGCLPSDLPLVWNPRLVATAGQVTDDGSKNSLKVTKDQRIPCRLELSCRLLCTFPRLRSTLAHEMCHVAAWVLEREWSSPHGAAFWKWANALMAHDAHSISTAPSAAPLRSSNSSLSSSFLPSAASASTTGVAAIGTKRAVVAGNGAGVGWSGFGANIEEDREKGVEGEGGRLIITRLHNFQTHMPHRWQCSNERCGKVYNRHRNTIDIARHVCAQCKGRLLYLGRFGKNNKVLAPRADKLPATPGLPAPGVKAPATPNAYALFVKENMSTVKMAHPKGTPMSTIMKAVGIKWTEHKASQQPKRRSATADTAAPLPRRLSAELEHIAAPFVPALTKSSPTIGAPGSTATLGPSALSSYSGARAHDTAYLTDQAP